MNNLSIYSVVSLLFGIMHKTSGWKEMFNVSMSQFIFLRVVKTSPFGAKGALATKTGPI